MRKNLNTYAWESFITRQPRIENASIKSMDLMIFLVIVSLTEMEIFY